MSERAVAAKVAERIRGEIDLLNREVQLAMRDWAVARTSADHQDAFLNSVALHLHSFYNGLESLFRIIALELDNSVPDGPAWHLDLLTQMSVTKADRPAVIRAGAIGELDVLRSFRHRIRNIYAANLDAELMSDTLTTLPELFDLLQRDLLAFADQLDGV